MHVYIYIYIYIYNMYLSTPKVPPDDPPALADGLAVDFRVILYWALYHYYYYYYYLC